MPVENWLVGSFFSKLLSTASCSARRAYFCASIKVRPKGTLPGPRPSDNSSCCQVTHAPNHRGDRTVVAQLLVDRLRAALLMVRAASRADASQPDWCVGCAAPPYGQ